MHLFCANASYETTIFFLFFLFFPFFLVLKASFVCLKHLLWVARSPTRKPASRGARGTKMLRLEASQHNWDLMGLDLPRKLLGWNEHEWSFSLLSHPYIYGWPSSIPFCPISAPTVTGRAYRLVLSSIYAYLPGRHQSACRAWLVSLNRP